MKIIKTYKLTEDSLEKDLDGFIRDAKGGRYQCDYKYGQEGLKLIKAYFRMIEEEFKKGNFEVSKECYKKMMSLLLQSEHNYFDYEDIVGKLNFEKFIAHYFTCVVKCGSIEELFRQYLEYIKIKPDYDFESAHTTILSGLTNENLVGFKNLVETEAENVREDNSGFYDLIYFLLDYAKFNKDKESYYAICDKYSQFVDEEQKEEFETQD